MSWSDKSGEAFDLVPNLSTSEAREAFSLANCQARRQQPAAAGSSGIGWKRGREPMTKTASRLAKITRFGSALGHTALAWQSFKQSHVAKLPRVGLVKSNYI